MGKVYRRDNFYESYSYWTSIYLIKALYLKEQ